MMKIAALSLLLITSFEYAMEQQDYNYIVINKTGHTIKVEIQSNGTEKKAEPHKLKLEPNQFIAVPYELGYGLLFTIQHAGTIGELNDPEPIIGRIIIEEINQGDILTIEYLTHSSRVDPKLKKGILHIMHRKLGTVYVKFH